MTRDDDLSPTEDDDLPEDGGGGQLPDEEIAFDRVDDIDEASLGAGLDEGSLDLDEDDIESEDDFEEEEEEEGAEEGEGGEEGGDAPAKPKSRSKKRKGSDEDEEIEHPNTPIPTAKKMRSALDKAFAGQDEIDDRILDLMTQHALHLFEANRVMNLTSIVDPLEAAIKHYLDSWRVTRSVSLMARSILDLGSGGGFPGIPVAIAEPQCSMILCESIGKKAKFLQETVEKLGLKNVRVVHDRAEEFLATHEVNVVLIRAVSSVRENIRTLRKVRHAVQDVVMLKGNSWGREVRAAEREAERLGFKLDTVNEHALPEEMGARAIVVYRAPGGDGR
ncbi:MAG: 16S rRNA (guanine(527)-N(7))-methyltransferase RsmG [Planctomycetota bacterium]